MAYVDFHAAFDSISRQSLWLLLRKNWSVPSKTTEFLEDLYNNIVSYVRVDGQLSLQGCIVALNMFLEPIDWTITCTVHHGYVDLMLGKTDLDFADDVAILSEMLEILILAVQILNEELSALGLEINWSKTKIHTSCVMKPSTVSVLNNLVDVMDFFVYLGSCIDSGGGNDQGVRSS